MCVCVCVCVFMRAYFVKDNTGTQVGPVIATEALFAIPAGYADRTVECQRGEFFEDT